MFPGRMALLEMGYSGCDRSWTAWNTWTRRGAETYGRDLPADVSQQTETVVLGIGSFWSGRAVVDPRNVRSSSPLSCNAASAS
jgi:hypothetical protein